MQEIDQTSDSHERNKSLKVLGIPFKMEAGKAISQNQWFFSIGSWTSGKPTFSCRHSRRVSFLLPAFSPKENSKDAKKRNE